MFLIKIQPHSLVDLITNSSTEIFVIQTDKSVEVVREIIDDLQLKYPNEYGHHLTTDIASEEDIKSIYGYEYANIETLTSMMQDLGYTVTKNPDSPIFLRLSAERGGLDFHVKQFIEKNFNVVDYDFDR